MELTPTLILNLALLIVPPVALVLVFRQWLARHIRWTVALTALCDVLLFWEGNGQTAYIKPQNYEISKTRKYKKDISRRENMEYHADRDSYICRNGRELTVTNERRSKTASGSVSVKTYYRSPDCTGCPYKTECIKGNNCKTPMEKRNKVDVYKRQVLACWN